MDGGLAGFLTEGRLAHDASALSPPLTSLHRPQLLSGDRQHVNGVTLSSTIGTPAVTAAATLSASGATSSARSDALLGSMASSADVDITGKTRGVRRGWSGGGGGRG